MNAKTEMMRAHEAMAVVLDAKFSNVPEWQAFRAIDRALLALESEQPIDPPPRERSRITRAVSGEVPSYVSLALKSFEETGAPIPTPKLMEFVAGRRQLPPDPNRAKVNVTSSLSKEKRIKSVPWLGGRAWWYADRPVPKAT
ncbi:MAG TPA: hypothetical protein VK653_09220 [Xanthobacteraceae bacterium]|nr:hypothetical protein [Xanthobacteraceae bacterium]